MTVRYDPAPASARRVLTIGELVRDVASWIERSFPLVWVAGEISNLVRAGSGHVYFSLKDRDAQARCVLFRMRAQQLDWAPKNGDHVEARVLPGLYVARGDFQLQVEQMRRAGAGTLFESFLRIKAALEAAGLFDPVRKRPLPRHPRRIGIVTSTQAAALGDVLATLARRSPHVEVLLFPTPVQGQDAPARLVEAIALAAHEGAAHAIDVLLVVRGGGSIEDLWAFNDEAVARAIVASTVPVVSGVGHETDFTIADFVADLRAPTPTAAAELASPDAAALATMLAGRRATIRRAFERALNARMQRVDEAARRLRSPSERLQSARDRLDLAVRRLMRAQGAALATQTVRLDTAARRLGAARPDGAALAARHRTLDQRLALALRHRLRSAAVDAARAAERLALLDPRSILGRGYAIVTDEGGFAVRDAARVHVGERVTVEVARGRFVSTVDGPDG